MEASPVFFSGFEKCKLFSRLKLNPTEYKNSKKNSLFPFCINADSHLVGKIESDKNGDYSVRFFMSYCSVIQTEISEETKQATLIIQYYNGINMVESAFAGEVLTKVGARELLNRGIRFREQDVQLVIEFILRSATLAPTKKSYIRHRFLIENDKLKYFYFRLIGDKKHCNNYVYRGQMDISPTGDLNTWIEMVRNEVIGNSNLEFILLSSFSSAILSILNLQFDFGSILIHLANHSSKGKTTAAMLAASVWSNPMLNRGTAVSYNATENALTDFVSNCNGLCVVLDESSVSQTANLQKLLFELTLGRSKMRLNSDSSMRKTKEFSSIIVSTSELSFISEETLNGIRARVFEVSGELTKSAESADNIKRVVIGNYALAGEPFLIYLTARGLKNIVDDYTEVKNRLFELYQETRFSNVEATLIPRILSKFAIILLARYYVELVFNLDIDSNNLFNYLLQTAQNIELSPTIENRIVDVVFADVTANAGKYYDYTQALQFSDGLSPLFGIIRESHEKGFFEVCVLDVHFERLMKENGFAKTEFNRSLRVLRKNGFFIAQPDRLRTRIPLAKSRPDSLFYVFRYPEISYPLN